MTDILIPSTPALQSDATKAPADRKTLAAIARNTAAMLGGQILIKILSFTFSVYVVRRLGAADFGRYSAAMAFAFIFAMLTELGTSALAVREMARKEENIAWMVPNIIVLRALLSLVVIIGTTVSAWLLGKTPDLILGIFIASLGLLLYAFQGPFDAVMIARERLDYSSVFNLLNQITFVTLGTIALLAGAGYIGLLLASLAGILVMGFAALYVVRRVLQLEFHRPDPRRWLPLLHASFPFGVIGLISEFSQRFDVVFMSFVLTYAAIGWYNVPLNLILMMLLLAQSLALAIYPTMVKEYDSGHGSIRDTVHRAVRYLLLVSLPMAIGGMLLADRIILLLYGERFSAAIPVMQVMVWAMPFLFLAEILGRTSSALHLERKAAAIIFFNALVTVALDVVLIPRWGVVSAAFVMVISRLVNVLLSVIIIGPALIFKGNVRPLVRVIGAGILMGFIVWILRDAPFLATWDGKIALMVLVGIGGFTYIAAIFLLRAITPGEAHYVFEMVQHRVKRARL